MTQQTEHVVQYMHKISTGPFVWGLDDCGMSVAEYVKRVCGRDPAIGMRGCYDSRRSCYAWIKRTYGSLLQMAIDGFGGAGLQYTSGPVCGDVGVVRYSPHGRHVIALCVGDSMWATRTPEGKSLVAPAVVVKAWRVECLQ